MVSIPSMDGVEANSFNLIPKGTYVVAVEEAKEVRGASNGTPGIALVLKIVGPTHKNRNLWDDLWITEKALGRLRSALEALRVPIPSGGFSLDPSSLVGRACRVIVDHEPWETTDKDTGEVKRGIKAVVKAYLKTEDAGGVAGPAPAAADSDIPFHHLAFPDGFTDAPRNVHMR